MSLLICWIAAFMQTCRVPPGAESGSLASRCCLSPAAAQLWGGGGLAVSWNTVAGAGISNLQSGCILQWVESTLHGVCSYSAVGNLCSALLCVELDVSWIFFWCLSSINALAGYILKLFLSVVFFWFCFVLVWHTWIYSLKILLHQRSRNWVYVWPCGIKWDESNSFGFHSQQVFTWCKLLFYHQKCNFNKKLSLTAALQKCCKIYFWVSTGKTFSKVCWIEGEKIPNLLTTAEN